MAPTVVAEFVWGWDFFVAIGTLGLAGFTAWLARATRDLATAGREEQRAQWRPVVVPGVDEDVREQTDHDGRIHLTLTVRNIGRGPAFSVQAQVRNGRHPLGASIPNTMRTLAAGEEMNLRMRLVERPDDKFFARHWPPGVLEIELSYFDLDERWHHTDLMSSRRPGDPRRAGRTIVRQTERRLGPVHGSKRAIAEQERHDNAKRTKLARRAHGLASTVRKRLPAPHCGTTPD